MAQTTAFGIREGRLAKKIEERAAEVSPVNFLALAGASVAASALIAIFGRRKELANFVGLWAPSLLLLGIYNKLVKLEESDVFTKH